MAGDVAIYSADSRNIHSVDEIKSGERLTLTLWFTRDASYDEDAKLISLLLSQNISLENSSSSSSSSLIPLPASSNMYWYSSLETESGEEAVEFDVRLMRLALLGYDVCPATQEGSRSSNVCCELERLDDGDVVLEKPLWLVRGDALLNVEFGNIMHGLQVVEFYSWKKASMSGQEEEFGWTENYESRSIDITRCWSTAQRETSRQLKSGLMKDRWDVAKNVFRHCSAVYGKSSSSSSREYKEFSSDEGGICDAVKGWEVYSLNLRKQLVMSLPIWLSHQSIFSVVFVPAEDVVVR